MSQGGGDSNDARLALALSRRVVLTAAGGVGLALGCGEGAAELLVDGLEPVEPISPYPLDTEGDDEMPPVAPGVRSPYYSALYDPLILYANCFVTPGSGVSPNTAALMNPHGASMELLEVRFRAYPYNQSVTNQFFNITGMAIGVKMDLGLIPVVDADVAMNAFSGLRDADDTAFQASTNNIVLFPNQQVTTHFATPVSYRWRLKHPLYIPAGCVLTPVFTHLGQIHFGVVVDVAYVCRTLPPNYVPPQSVAVPWVGSYNSTSFDNITVSEPAGQDFSSELDIVNPFSQPLELTRLSGQAALNAEGKQLFEDFEDFRYKLCTLRIRSRSGDEIARTATPFNGLFPATWRVWDIPNGWVLPPGEFYKVQLAVAASNAVAPAATQGVLQFSMAGIGYRKLSRNVFLKAAGGAA